MIRLLNKMDDFQGWLLVDKPAGISSSKTVLKISRNWHRIKLGHGGTLDPFATGLLPVALGEATKTVGLVMNYQKTYRFSVKWGITTDTLDCEGEIVSRSEIRPDLEQILRVLPSLKGEIMQIPPAYSAIKVKGKRAYSLARKGITPELPPRKVWVSELTLVEHNPDDSTLFEMTCGKGVYVRSIVRDLAARLDCCAMVETLRRTRIGFFSLKDSLSLDKILKIPYTSPSDDLTKAACFVTIEEALKDLPSLRLDPAEALKLKNGVWIPTLKAKPRVSKPRVSNVEKDERKLVVWSLGQVVALAECQDGYIKPKRVFNNTILPLYTKGSL